MVPVEPQVRDFIQIAEFYLSSSFTDINTPLMWALKILNQAKQQNPNRLPFVVLLTDGAVQGEKYENFSHKQTFAGWLFVFSEILHVQQRILAGMFEF